MDKETKSWCQRYEARIENTGRYHRRAERSPWKMSDYHQTSIVNEDNFIHITEIPVMAISLPADRLSALIEHEQRVTDMVERKPMYPTRYSVLEHIIKEHEEECLLRSTNPALQKAWENYQIILSMIK